MRPHLVYVGTRHFCQALPYSGYQPREPGRSGGATYTCNTSPISHHTRWVHRRGCTLAYCSKHRLAVLAVHSFSAAEHKTARGERVKEAASHGLAGNRVNRRASGSMWAAGARLAMCSGTCLAGARSRRSLHLQTNRLWLKTTGLTLRPTGLTAAVKLVTAGTQWFHDISERSQDVSTGSGLLCAEHRRAAQEWPRRALIVLEQDEPAEEQQQRGPDVEPAGRHDRCCNAAAQHRLPAPRSQ